MTITVSFWGPAKDAAGQAEVALTMHEGASTQDLCSAVVERFPRMATGMKSWRLAVNEDFIAGARVLKSGDRVAFIPPVSGG